MTRKLSGLVAVGHEVGRYRVLTKIAKGGMATVYAVHRTGVGRFEKVLALKLMHSHLADDDRFVEMFLDEIRLSAFIEHPNVVRVLDVGEHDGLPYMVMEYLRGQPLSALLTRASPEGVGPKLPPEALWSIVLQAAKGLAAAHDTADLSGSPLGIVHRDVSPQNIHVGYDGRVRIVDFGIAAGLGRNTATQTGEIKGKVGYMAPEQIRRDSEIDRRVDVWALGVVAWEALAGKRMFKKPDAASTMYQVLSGAIPPVPEGTSPGLAKALQGCLERHEAMRYSGASEFADAIVEEFPDLHASGPAHVAEYMTQAFANEREQDTTIIQTAVADASSVATPERGAFRIKWAIAGVIGVSVLAALFMFGPGLVGGSQPSASEPVETERVESSSPQPAADPETRVEPELALVELTIDPSVQRVEIEGVTHRERPVVVELEQGQTIAVELVGAGGERELVRVGEVDHRATLAMSEAESPPETELGMRATMRSGMRPNRASMEVMTMDHGLLPPPPGL